MKKILTLLVALTATVNAMAYQFLGDADIQVKMPAPMNTVIATMSNSYNTMEFNLTDATKGSITLPSMTYSGMVIPAITINDIECSFTAGVGAVIKEGQMFTQTIDGTSCTVTFNSGKYDMVNKVFTMNVTLKYGSMPMLLVIDYTGDYITNYKKYTKTDNMDVTIGTGVMKYTYAASGVTYDVHRYTLAGKEEQCDVVVPTYTLSGTMMGELTIGGYTVKGLAMDYDKSGFYRNYVGDGLTMQFKSVSDGTVGFNDTYPLSSGTQDILVKVSGDNILVIKNNFKPGNMPFPIASEFPSPATSVSAAAANAASATPVKVLSGGKIIIVKDGKKYNTNGTEVK